MIPFRREEVHFHFSDFRGRKKSRYTIASFLDAATRTFYFGVSRCDPMDNFDRPKGKAIAIARLEAYINCLNNNQFLTLRLTRYVSSFQLEPDEKLTLRDQDFNNILENWRNVRQLEQEKITEDLFEDLAHKSAIDTYEFGND